MNVLKPNLQATIKTLLTKDLSQREINRKTGIDRKTIRRYGRLYDLLPARGLRIQNPPPQRGWPPAPKR